MARVHSPEEHAFDSTVQVMAALWKEGFSDPILAEQLPLAVFQANSSKRAVVSMLFGAYYFCRFFG
jgi:hypothetical protein